MHRLSAFDSLRIRVVRTASPRVRLVVRVEFLMAGAVFTIGYGGGGVDDLVERLAAVGVSHVADVRSQPFSGARPEFNGVALRATLSDVGVGYVFLGGELGGRPPGCRLADGRVDYAHLACQPFFVRGLQRVLVGIDRGFVVGLLCSEARPESCHRALVVGESLMSQFGVDVRHVDPDGTVAAHRDVIDRLSAGQLSFGFIDPLRESPSPPVTAR